MTVPISLGSNISSLLAMRNLSRNTTNLSNVHTKLSSGQRINKASDDAAGLAISLDLRKDAHVYTQGIRNINDGVSLVSIADGALSSLTDIAIRRKELAEQAANGTYTDKQREVMNNEFQALDKEMTRILESTQYNGVNIFSEGLYNLTIQTAHSYLTLDLGDSTSGLYLNRHIGVLSKSSYSVIEPDGATGKVALADFNGDGILDMVTTDYGTAAQCIDGNCYSSTAVVAMGRGDGTFERSAVYELGECSRPYGISIADINSDGMADIVVNTQQDDKIYLMTNNGDGSFTVGDAFDPGLLTLTGMATGDINGDGNVDIVATGKNGGLTYYAYVELGDGAGGFTASSTGTAVGRGPFAVATGNINNDANGYDDVIIGNRTTGSVSVLLSNGTSTLGAATNYNMGAPVYDVTTADLDGDGNLDMIVANGNNVSIMRGNGDGTFSDRQDYAAGNIITSVAVGDLDGDGILDIAATSGVDSEVAILKGNGDGTFEMGTSFKAGLGPNGIAIGDMNGDGKDDIATANSKDGTASAFVMDNISLEITTVDKALHALDMLDVTLNAIGAIRGKLGAFQSRLSTANNVLVTTRENINSAHSTIMDADIAEESANMIRLQILQEVGGAVLKQANIKPELAMRLLKTEDDESNKPKKTNRSEKLKPHSKVQ